MSACILSSYNSLCHAEFRQTVLVIKDIICKYTMCCLIKQQICSAAAAMLKRCVLLQFLEVAYMLYVGRWFLPVLILILLTAASVNLVLALRRQRKKVMAMVNECRLTALVWDGWVRAVSSHRLVPGDIIVLRQGKAVCDMVILQGACLVMESMLSGEVSDLHQPK